MAFQAGLSVGMQRDDMHILGVYDVDYNGQEFCKTRTLYRTWLNYNQVVTGVTNCVTI